jgi:hypothetical protein
LNISLLERLSKEGYISDQSLTRIKNYEASRQFSIYWESRTLLYVGVLLVTSGLGILIYKNIDSIGHHAVLALIAILTAGCFVYCVRKKLPFGWQQVPAPNTYFDYVLLLGCLSLLTFIGYLHAQFQAFGDAYGLTTFVPMTILFFCAYYFDHLGVLALGITNLAAWVGIVITPREILSQNDFSNEQIIFGGILLGSLLSLVSQFSRRRQLKSHFSFTYLNFGMNILFISCLAGMFQFDSIYLAWVPVLAALAWHFYRESMIHSSFYIRLMIVVYCYIGAGYVITSLIYSWTLWLLYFIISAIYAVILLMKLNKSVAR